VLLGRRNHRCVAWLGLFAIWLQVVVTFPHVCPDDIAALAAYPGLDPEIISGGLNERDLPLCPLSDGRGGHTCLIYATVHLAGSPLLPDAITLDLASRRGSTVLARETQMHLARPHRLLFETRAPPVL
jgi:hypothetical protein